MYKGEPLYQIPLFQAITGLNGMALGDKKLIVQRASVGAKNPLLEQALMAGMPLPISIPGLQIDGAFSGSHGGALSHEHGQ